jgi:hypothetical protein
MKCLFKQLNNKILKCSGTWCRVAWQLDYRTLKLEKLSSSDKSVTLCLKTWILISTAVITVSLALVQPSLHALIERPQQAASCRLSLEIRSFFLGVWLLAFPPCVWDHHVVLMCVRHIKFRNYPSCLRDSWWEICDAGGKLNSLNH